MRLREQVDLTVLGEAQALEEGSKAAGFISTDSLPKFRHINAESIEDALFWLKTYGSKAAVIAGGADLLRELKHRARPTQPEVLINIKTAQPALNYIEEQASYIALGSLTTLDDIEASELIQRRCSILADAAHATKSPQYRNMATLGGDLCQHTACWYNRASGNAFHCLRKGGDRCYAVAGDNRYHSVFGDGPCVAVCPSDTAPALVALGAKVKITGASGERIVPVDAFFTTLGTILRPDDLVTEIQIPKSKPGTRCVFQKIGLGNLYGRAIVSAAIALRTEDTICKEATIVLGAVSPAPWRAIQAEQMLLGNHLTSATAQSAAHAALEDATPLRMNAYKVEIVKALVKRAIVKLAQDV